MGEELSRVPDRPSASRAAPLGIGLLLTAGGWAVLWGVVSFWNPLAFTAMWTGAAMVMWALSPAGYPGARRHAALALVSLPFWWWFELVDARTENWSYVNPFTPGPVWYTVLSSIAFATVVPAVSAATALVRRFAAGPRRLSTASKRFAAREIAWGLLLQVLVFAFPMQTFPLVWVAPFLVADGVGGLLDGRSLLAAMTRGAWREGWIVAAAGLLCGVLWEFWNYWAVPSWEYRVPYVGFFKVFEMPILGYLGYVPFAWSIVRLVDVVDGLVARARKRPAA
jgi:hypothetical protein